MSHYSLHNWKWEITINLFPLKYLHTQDNSRDLIETQTKIFKFWTGLEPSVTLHGHSVTGAVILKRLSNYSVIFELCRIKFVGKNLDPMEEVRPIQVLPGVELSAKFQEKVRLGVVVFTSINRSFNGTKS